MLLVRLPALALVACALLGSVVGAAEPGAVREILARQSSAHVPSTVRLNPGADTCDAAIDVGAIPPGSVELSLMLDPGDVEWRSFRLAGTRAVAVTTVGDPLHADTNLALLARCSDGVPSFPIEVNEDRAVDDYTSRIPLEGGRCLPPGTYFVYVGSFLLLGTEVPFELRIDDLGPCPLPPKDRFEPDDTQASARRIGVGRPFVGGAPSAPGGTQPRTIFPMGDVDVARFVLDEPAMVRVRASSPGNGDTLLGIARAPSGALIGINDDESPTSLASRFETCLPAGSWSALVLARIAPDMFAYDLSVEKTTPCAFEREPNATGQHATALPLRGNRGMVWGLQDWGSAGADVDVYRIVVPARRGVVLETSGYDVFDVDTRIELLDAHGTTIASDDDGGQGFLSRIESVLASGTYYVAVTASTFEDPGNSWVYSLSVTLQDPPPVESEPNDACDQAGPVTPSRYVLAAIAPAGDRDHYLLSLPPSSQGGFNVEVIVHSTGDPVLDVFEDPGECAFRAACDDDSGEGLDPQLSCCFAGGAAYTLRVRDFRDDDPVPAYSIEVRVGDECVPTVGCPVVPGQFGCD